MHNLSFDCQCDSTNRLARVTCTTHNIEFSFTVDRLKDVQAAMHEAAHIVGAFSCGLPVQHAHIVKAGRRWGQTTFTESPSILTNLFVLLVGPAINEFCEIKGVEKFIHNEGNDENLVRKMLEPLRQTKPQDADELEKIARARAKSFVRTEKECSAPR